MLASILYQQLMKSTRYSDPKRLVSSGFKIYSQHDEDGITEAIFDRIGVTDRRFVEFGVGDGVENGTLYCLLKGWEGAWIEGSAACFEAIQAQFAFLVADTRLRIRHALVTPENIETLFEQLEVPAEFDFLSIDIDNHDYWVWRGLRRYRPRVVAIEYNASFGDRVRCVIPYRPGAIWDYTNYFGASLKALEELGLEKGYRLVGCNVTGVTAFFVREDLVGDSFAEPFSAENHYEPPRYYLRMPNGHAPGFGPLVDGSSQPHTVPDGRVGTGPFRPVRTKSVPG